MIDAYGQPPSCDTISENDITSYPPKFHANLTACFDNSGVPCSVTGCGRFASCPSEEGATCVCDAGTQFGPTFEEDRTCIPIVASVDQQRIFWTLSCESCPHPRLTRARPRRT